MLSDGIKIHASATQVCLPGVHAAWMGSGAGSSGFLDVILLCLYMGGRQERREGHQEDSKLGVCSQRLGVCHKDTKLVRDGIFMALSNPNSLLKARLKLLGIGVLDHSSHSMQPSSIFFPEWLNFFFFFYVLGSLEVSTFLELSLGREELHTVGLLISPAVLTSVEPFFPLLFFWFLLLTPTGVFLSPGPCRLPGYWLSSRLGTLICHSSWVKIPHLSFATRCVPHPASSTSLCLRHLPRLVLLGRSPCDPHNTGGKKFALSDCKPCEVRVSEWWTVFLGHTFLSVVILNGHSGVASLQQLHSHSVTWVALIPFRL